MKVYFVDTEGKNEEILKKVEEVSGIQVLVKENYSFRSTKNDLVIIGDYSLDCPENEALKKHANVIVLSKCKGENIITTLAKDYDVKDVIYLTCDVDYIAARICEHI